MFNINSQNNYYEGSCEMNSINEFQVLISKGQYSEIINKIDNLKDPSDRELLFKSEALIYEGSFDNSLQIINKVINKEDLSIRIEAIRQKSLVHWSLGELNQAISVIQTAINLIPILKPDTIEKRALKAHVYHSYGTFCQSMGRLDDALQYLEDSLVISKETNYKHRIAATSANLGITFSYKGEKTKTLEYYNQALLILQELGSTSEQALVHGLIGETYWEYGVPDKAIIHVKLSLDILRETKNYYRIADALYVLIDILVLNNMMESAKEYYEDLVEINSNSDANNIRFMTRYSEALILKFSNRMKQKSAAQEIFEQLLLEELDFEIWNNIVLHLSDLLLDELRIYSDPEVLSELTRLSDQRYRRAQNQNNKYLEVEALILMGKMELINTNFKTADELFARASEIAKYNGQEILVESANSERKKLEDDIKMWEELLIKGSSIKERIEQSKIRNYLDHILSINRAVLVSESDN
ncbi:MAG: Photosystem I assembly protein Ycf3 [Candidatus Heimdallarchaeota archaeon LC_2]|nr:MAG: Photosystem I assembly protein Ycf3 [Candidatus Heimdallarchaeota archaeon LC_2]